jgi:hypothetical protein
MDLCTESKIRQILLFVKSEENNVHIQHENLKMHNCIQHYGIISRHCRDNNKGVHRGAQILKHLKRRGKPELIAVSKLIPHSNPVMKLLYCM